jgi:dolichol-phosphate mannosyltransferase
MAKTIDGYGESHYNNAAPTKTGEQTIVKATVIIPTYNERDNIQSLVGEILALDPPVDVIVVDDNSPDGTGELVDELAEKHPGRVHVIHRPSKMGLGTAHIAGFKLALEQGAQRVMSMDADFSHHPRHISAMLAKSHEAHLVIGSRYVRGGGTRFCSWKRRILSLGANLFAKLMLGLPARDCTAGFRCYHSDVLSSIKLDDIFSNGYSFLIEMIYRTKSQDWRVAEVPIIFEDRRHGVSKISRVEIFAALYTVLRLSTWRLRQLPGSQRVPRST